MVMIYGTYTIKSHFEIFHLNNSKSKMSTLSSQNLLNSLNGFQYVHSSPSRT